MSALPELKRRLRIWAKRALPILVRDPSSVVALSPLGRWHGSNDGSFHHSSSSYSWRLGSDHEVFRLPEWTAIRTLIEQDTWLDSQVDKLVGAGDGATVWRLDVLAHQLLPHPAKDVASLLQSLDREFGKRFKLVEELLGSEDLRITKMWPLLSLKLPEDRIRLDSETELRVLTSEEFEMLLNVGFINPGQYVSYLTREQGEVVGLFRTTRPKKRLGPALETNPGLMEGLYRNEMRFLDDFQALLGLIGISVPVGAYLFTDSRRLFGLQYGFKGDGPPSATLLFSRSQAIPSSAVRNVKNGWRILRNRNEKDLGLQIAALRLFYAQQRYDLSEQILDVMIAAEALYLGTGSAQDRGKLTYRLALNAAFWSDARELGMSRRRVFSVMKKAYNVRSTVAHGSKPDASLKIDGESLKFHELVELSTKIVRTGLLKAFRAAGRNKQLRFAPDWDRLILGR